MTSLMDRRRDFETGTGAAEKAVFIYETLDPDVGEKLRACAGRIRVKNQALNETIFEIGRELNDAKEWLPRGQFLAWLRCEFNWPERTAQRYMRIARVLGNETDTVSDLSFRAMDALSAKSTPEELRNELLAEIAAGSAPSNRELAKRLKKARCKAVVDDAAVTDDEEAAESPVFSPPEAARRAAEFIRRQLGGELAKLGALLDQADPAVLLADLRQAAAAD